MSTSVHVPSIRLRSSIFEGHPFERLVRKIQSRFDGVVPPFSSIHPFGKALQSIVVSCHRQKVVVALIPINAGSGKDEQPRLDLILAPTNLKDFQVEVVLKSTNTALEFTSDLLEPTSKRSLESTSNLKRNLNFINQYLIKDEYKIKNTRAFYRLTKEYYSY